MSLLPSRGPDASTSQDGEIEILGVDEDVSAVIDALSTETARQILNAVYDDPGTPSELAERLEMSIQKVSYHLEKLQEEDLIAVAGTRYSEKGQEMKVFQPPEDPLVLFVGTKERKRSLRALAQRLLPAAGVLTAASVVVQMLTGGLPFGTGSAGGATGGDGGYQAEEAGGDAGGDTSLASQETPTAEPTPEPTTTESADSGASIAEVTETDAATPTEVATEAPTPAPTTESAGAVDTTTPTEAATELASSSGADPLLGGVHLEPGVAFFLGGLVVLVVVAAVWAAAE